MGSAMGSKEKTEEDGKNDDVRITQEIRITQIDLLDTASVMVTFSNGISARVASEDVKRLALEKALEIVTDSDHVD